MFAADPVLWGGVAVPPFLSLHRPRALANAFVGTTQLVTNEEMMSRPNLARRISRVVCMLLVLCLPVLIHGAPATFISSGDHAYLKVTVTPCISPHWPQP